MSHTMSSASAQLPVSLVATEPVLMARLPVRLAPPEVQRLTPFTHTLQPMLVTHVSAQLLLAMPAALERAVLMPLPSEAMPTSPEACPM